MYKYLAIIFLSLGLLSCANNTTEEQEQKEIYTFDTKAAKRKYESNKSAVQAAKATLNLKQKLREEIGLNKFNGQDIEISEAQLWYEDQNIKSIDAGFFDGAPIGVKHWFCDAGHPVAVEVAVYKTDTEGLLIEQLQYTVLFDPVERQDGIINAKEELSSEQQAVIFSENRKEWVKLKALAEKYKPKAE